MMRTVVVSVAVGAAMSVASASLAVYIVSENSPGATRCPDDPLTMCERDRASWDGLERVGAFMTATQDLEDGDSKDRQSVSERLLSLERSALGWAKAGELDGSWHCMISDGATAKFACFPTALLCSVAAAGTRPAACIPMRKAFCTEGDGFTQCFSVESQCKEHSTTRSCRETEAFDPKPILDRM